MGERASTRPHTLEWGKRAYCRVCQLTMPNQMAGSVCPGVPYLPYDEYYSGPDALNSYLTPKGLATARLLRTHHHRKLAPNQEPVAAVWMNEAPGFRWCYRIADAIPLRPQTPAQLAARERMHTCTQCGERSDQVLKHRQPDGTYVCTPCVSVLGYRRQLLPSEGWDLADPRITAQTLEGMSRRVFLALLEGWLQPNSLATRNWLSCLPDADPPAEAPDMAHLAAWLAANLNASAVTLAWLADVVPFAVLEHDGWAFLLMEDPTLQALPFSALTRLAICQHLRYGTSRKNHWLARWYTRVLRTRDQYPSFPFPSHWLPGQWPDSDEQMALHHWERAMAAMTPLLAYRLSMTTTNGVRLDVTCHTATGQTTTVLLDLPNPTVQF